MNVLSRCRLKSSDFPQIIYPIFSQAQDFLLIKFFFNCYFKNPCSQLPQNVLWTDEISRVIIASTGKNAATLARHISQIAGWLIFFNVFFETDIGREQLRKIWKKIVR